MQIKTITCHDVYNYGASLQAYALMKFLEELGHNVEVIDYKPDYINRTYNFWYIPQNSRLYYFSSINRINNFLIALLFIPKNFKNWQRIIPFKDFKNKHLKCTRKYNTYEELKNDPPIADCYIAGSDQIWNSKLPNGKDPAFYLNFGNKNILRVSYAASFGIKELNQNIKKEIKQYLSVFNNISVREKSAIKILNELGYESTEVLDPVFLLEKQQWINFVNDNAKQSLNYKDYILVYDIFNDDNNLKENVKKFSEATNYKIIAINDKTKLDYADININNAGPIEFLNLIMNARYVFSCSFHATAFSVIFNIPFAVYYNKGNISRMEDFLNNLELTSCLNETQPENYFKWNRIESILKLKIKTSKDYIKSNIKK